MAREEAEIKELTKKLAQKPDSMVFAPLADAHRRLGQFEEAIRICQEGLEKNPAYMTARVILGRALMDTEALDEAAAEFEKIEAADPQNIMAHSMTGQIAMRQEQFLVAIEAFQKVLALNPDDDSAQSMLDEALARANQSGGAATTPTPVKNTRSEQMGSIKVADIYLKKGALDEAEEVVREILTADPDNPVARQKLQEIRTRRGPSREELAKEAARKAREEQEAEKNKTAVADDVKRKVEEARKKAEEEKKKAEEALQQAQQAKEKAEQAAKDAQAKEKGEKEEARQRALEAEKQKVIEAKAAAEKAKAEAQAKAEEAKAKAEAARLKAEAERKRALEEAHKAEEAKAAAKKQQAEAAAAKAAAEEEAKAKAAAEEARLKVEAEAKRKLDDEKKRKAESKLSSDDILSVMQSGGDDEIIEDEPGAAVPALKEAVPDRRAESIASSVMSPELEKTLREFNSKNAIQGSLLVSPEGKVLIDLMKSTETDAAGQTVSKLFKNTEKAVGHMQLGAVEQVMIAGDDGRQILFVSLKHGVLMAVTSTSSNLGLLRLAINELRKKAA